jgi:hypothetical protein
MSDLNDGPPMFLIIAAVLATLVVVAIVLFLVLRTIRREQRGFDVQPPPTGPRADPPAPPDEPR